MLFYPPEYAKDMSIRFTYHSTGIEGNRLTVGEVTHVLLHHSIMTVQSRSLREIYEVDNHIAAFHHLFSEAASKRKLDVPLLLDFHHDLTKNTMTSPGEFKQSSNQILGANFETASPGMAPILAKQWCDNLNYQLDTAKNESEVLTSLLDSHIKFEQMHPFEDGNGRTGRLLINFELAKREMPFLIIERDDRDEYLQYMSATNVPALVKYAEGKMAKEKERYDSYLVNYKRQQEFEQQQRQKMNFPPRKPKQRER